MDPFTHPFRFPMLPIGTQVDQVWREWDMHKFIPGEVIGHNTDERDRPVYEVLVDLDGRNPEGTVGPETMLVTENQMVLHNKGMYTSMYGIQFPKRRIPGTATGV